MWLAPIKANKPENDDPLIVEPVELAGAASWSSSETSWEKRTMRDHAVVRVSIGSFDPEKAADVEAKLIESKAELEAGIHAMRGNLGYYAGVDRINNAMSNVSIWDSIEAANQMATFQPMLNLAEKFVALGVRFQRPILNFVTVWAVP